MKPAPFDYHRPTSIEQAISLADAGDGYTKYLAGGQTLGPMINLRLTQPDALIDITAIPSMREVQDMAGAIRIGAGIRHAEIEDRKFPDPSQGLMPKAARTLAYRAVRNRGTIGGSLAHADPVAEWPTILVALNATVNVATRDGERAVAISDFLLGYLTTALEPSDIISAVTIPKLSDGSRIGFQKFSRKSGEFAHSLAVAVLGAGAVGRISLGCAGGTPILLPIAAEAIKSETQWKDGMDQMIRRAVSADLQAAAVEIDDYDAHLHGTIVSRAVREALS